MSDDIFDRIRRDHERHRTFLRILEQTHGDSSGRRELFPKLVESVRAHAAAEERVLYAELLAHPEGRDRAGHSVKEHHEADAIFEELLQKDYSDTGWLTRFKTLAEELRHHMKEEEREVFPLAERLISERRQREMAEELEHAKRDEEARVA